MPSFLPSLPFLSFFFSCFLLFPFSLLSALILFDHFILFSISVCSLFYLFVPLLLLSYSFVFLVSFLFLSLLSFCPSPFCSFIISLYLSLSQWGVINELEKLRALVQLSCKRNPLMDLEKNCETTHQLLLARISNLEILNRCEVCVFNKASRLCRH